jgi:hypothetical protein
MNPVLSVEETISTLAERNEQAVELAEAVSCAVRVEPFLLRRMRLEVLIGIDSGAEADVWLSDLVQTRSPEGVVFYPEVADFLRRSMFKRKPQQFRLAWSLIRESHAYLPQAIQLEEEIAYLSADPGAGAIREIDDLLKRAAKTLVTGVGREGLANWAARALPHLPVRVRNLEGARMLASASYLRLARQLPVADVDRNGPMPAWMAWILPSNLANTHVRVRLVLDGIELTLATSGENTIPVPDITPCLVEISWKENGRDEVRQVSLMPGDRTVVEAPARDFRIGTVLGKRFRLAEKPKKPEEPKMEPPAVKTCFVVMAFGKKTDYPTGRVLDLDKSYRYIIKPAVERTGMQCVRADEIQHAGNINVPMYEWLMKADIVIVDVSTYNPNAFYELGVRHALRPYHTLIIAEDKMVFPFDVGQIAVRRYQHLGEGIDFGEAERMGRELAEAIANLSGESEPDSPVYMFLSGLRPPYIQDAPGQLAPAAERRAEKPENPTVRTLMDQAEEAMRQGDFVNAKSLLSVAKSMLPTDTYVVQKLALATYKSELPTPLDALREAKGLLAELMPDTSTDTETLGLWGTVHKRMWELTSDPAMLNTSIDAYEKGFYLKRDYWNGINYAFILNVRAKQSPPAESVADFVVAQRVRRKVIGICEALLSTTESKMDRYWILSTLAEAWFGVGDRQKSEEMLERASAVAEAKWMRDSTSEQLKRLADLLADSPLDRAGLSSSKDA